MENIESTDAGMRADVPPELTPAGREDGDWQWGVRWDSGDVIGPMTKREAIGLVNLVPQWNGVVVARSIVYTPWVVLAE